MITKDMSRLEEAANKFWAVLLLISSPQNNERFKPIKLSRKLLIRHIKLQYLGIYCYNVGDNFHKESISSATATLLDLGFEYETIVRMVENNSTLMAKIKKYNESHPASPHTLLGFVEGKFMKNWNPTLIEKINVVKSL
ncbi:MAG: hypothetical protein FWE50_00215 [Alphaproteobacteria bacterium]|nr:hypothetical protein [Alphaproteobacteria bacterium]